MKLLLITICLFTLQSFAIASKNGSFTDPLDFIKQNKSKQQWFSYKVKAQDNTQSMCCWNQRGNSFNLKKYNNFDFQSCNLLSDSGGYGSNNNSPITENIHIYINVKKGKVQKILSVGDACEVKFNGEDVTLLENIDAQLSLKFLDKTADQSSEKIGHDALYAISYHQHIRASKILYDIALENNNKLSENAVFWLGESRNDGVKHLKTLYNKLPNGKVKEHINFALAQSKSSEGADLLKFIALKDKNSQQRADALFWLGQNHVDGIVKILLNSIDNDKSKQVQEKAIFGLSQVETLAATNALVKLAEKHPKKRIREKALFWLVEVNPDKASQLALRILNDDSLSTSEIEEAVFTISRIGEDNGDRGLFDLLKRNYSKKIKTKAIFWLAQSKNKETIERLASLF